MPGFTRDLRKRRSGYGGSKPIQARWTHPKDGRVKREKSFVTKTEATRWMREQEHDAEHGSWTDPRLGRHTLAAIADEWQQSRIKAGPKTRTGHDSILAAHVVPAFGDRQIATIDAADIQKWVNALTKKRAPNTVLNAFAVLRLVMEFAVRRRYIAVNPCGNVERPHKRRRIDIRPLTDDQVRMLAAAMPTSEARVAVLTAAYMGLRAGELWALRKSDVNVLKRELLVDEALKEVPSAQTEQLPEGNTRITPSLVVGPTKTHATRKLSMPSFVADELASIILPDATHAHFIFNDSDGGPIRHGNFYRRTYIASLPAELKGTRWQDLRHTCASLLIDEGAHPLSIKQHLGHESIRTTMDTYGHLFPAGQEALAESLDARYRAAQKSRTAEVRQLHQENAEGR